jgi:hypothetical protein
MSEEGDELTKPTTNTFIDKVTLELLMNKNHYNRYISQNDPKKHQEYLEHLAKVNKYRDRIVSTTKDFLDNTNHQITTEINEAFDYYLRTLIRHFECKEMENPEEFKQDDDMLFGNMDNEDTYEDISPSKSFWGKNKVVKKGNQMTFPMNYIPRIKEPDNLHP